MDIVNHSLCTRVLEAPADMPEPDCGKLPVAEFNDRYGNWMVSFWKPSKEEIAELAEGGTITLYVRADTDEAHPVVGLATQPKELFQS